MCCWGWLELVLLLACVNLVNLLLARATARQRELSTRLALGAGRVGIFRQLLTESLLLAGLGGLAGIALAYALRGALSSLLTESFAANFDWRVLVFAMGISLLTGVVFGSVPIWQGMQADVNQGLKDASHATMGQRKVWLGRTLVTAQVALSTILLLAAGLFVRTLTNQAHIPLGFRADHMLLFKINPPRSRYTGQRAGALYRQLEEKVAAIPGVRSETLSNMCVNWGRTLGIDLSCDGETGAPAGRASADKWSRRGFFSNDGHSDSSGTRF